MFDQQEASRRRRGMTPLTITLAAGVPKRFPVAGDWIACITAPAGVTDLTVRGDESEKVPLPQGLGFRYYYSEVELESATGGTFTVLVGFGSVSDARATINATLNITVAPGATLPSGGDVACNAGVATLLSALDATRLSITVDNPSTNSNTFRLGPAGVDGTHGFLLEPGQSKTIATKAALYAYNTNNGGTGAETLTVGIVQQ